MSFPMASLISSGGGDDITGSIRKLPLTVPLDSEDWRRAQAALATAMDPQGNGTSVAWDNPASGAKGAFVPVGKAYPADAQICRAFLADVSLKDTDRSLQGTACAEKSGDWTITDAKPWKRG